MTDRKLPIGTIVRNYQYITDTNCKRMPPQPVFIIRIATCEEWKEYVQSNGGRIGAICRPAYFYEVTTD